VGPRPGLDAVLKRKAPFPVPVGNRTPVVQPVTFVSVKYVYINFVTFCVKVFVR
jgi:hypothetical protein